MNGQGRLARLLAPQILRPAAAIAMFAVFGLALWVIHYETRTMSFEDIRAAIGNVGMIDVAAGCGLTALSFLMLIGFDALALRSSGIRVPFSRIAFAAGLRLTRLLTKNGRIITLTFIVSFLTGSPEAFL